MSKHILQVKCVNARIFDKGCELLTAKIKITVLFNPTIAKTKT